jgi:hypothetical protein
VQLFGTKGQKFLPCPGTKGQAQNLATGRDFDSLSRPGTSRGIEMKEKALKNEVFFYDILFQNIFSCFRTSFPELERLFLF